MNSTNNHIKITADLLKKYYGGELSEKEKNAVEKMALEDPFLKDAMDGYESDPGSFESFYNKRIKTKIYNSNLLLTIGTILTLGLVSILIVKYESGQSEVNQNFISANTPDSIITKEVEVYNVEIDTLILADNAELILPHEIAEAHTEIEKNIDYSKTETEIPILIKEEFKLEEDYVIEPEEYNLEVQELVPATYLFDLFVVDYRRIERDKNEIIYTKYEFTGTAAEYESETHEQNAELLEQQVNVSYWEYLSKGMESFANGNYKSALNRFQIILEQYPDDFNGLFYGGLCYYNLGSFNKSLNNFDQILSTNLNAFKEEAAWYKTKCLVKLGRKNEAIVILNEIIAGGGFYIQDAMAAKKKLQ